MAVPDLMPFPSSVPERSLVQRLHALERANEIRSKRARLKRDLKAKRRQLAPLVERPPDWLETAYVFDLLLAVPKVGRVKANRMLVAERISQSKTVGGLSERQRQALVTRLGWLR